MIRALFLATMMVALSGCAALVPAAIVTFEVISEVTAAAETTCRVGEDLGAANTRAMDGHPVLQAADKVCEALAP